MGSDLKVSTVPTFLKDMILSSSCVLSDEPAKA